MRTDTNIYYYQYQTRAGTVSLVPEPGGRYKVMFGDENLGSYHSAAAASDDVSGGHTFSPSNGVDLGELGIPEEPRRMGQEALRYAQAAPEEVDARYL